MISVVTPCLNEAGNLPVRARELAGQGADHEWIVVDGGSEDGSVAVADDLGAKVLHAPKGRGPQLNAGARRARGDILLFLHADTSLPSNGLDAVRHRMASDERVLGGHFTIRFAGDHWESRALEVGYRVFEAIFGVYFGDSVIFVRRTVFRDLGGFPDQVILEDYDFVRRLERAGSTCQLDARVTSSDRRYRGAFPEWVVRWLGILGLYELGVSAEALSRLYPAPGE